MADALTPPLLIASAVLIVAAVAKLRAPAGAVGALVTLGVPVRGAAARLLVRVLPPESWSWVSGRSLPALWSPAY